MNALVVSTLYDPEGGGGGRRKGSGFITSTTVLVQPKNGEVGNGGIRIQMDDITVRAWQAGGIFFADSTIIQRKLLMPS